MWKLWVIVGSLWAQKILTRSLIEVQGYPIDKVGLPQSPAYAGRGRFAYIEYWAKDKPRPGWYVECLNLGFYSQWSFFIDVPEAGQGKPLRLFPLKEALVLVSYDTDPLNKGAIQEVGRFLDAKGQSLFPKWTPLSVYDRPAPEAISRFSVSLDSTHLLWYAYSPGKKGGAEKAWYALWSSSGRKVFTSQDWYVRGAVLHAVADARLNLWTLQQPAQGLPELVYYDLKARTQRIWSLQPDTILRRPWLLVTPKAIYVGGLISGTKTIPHEAGSIGGWAIGKLALPFSDTSQIVWSRVPFPESWSASYKEPTNFLAGDAFMHQDSALYVIWEDRRVRGGTFTAQDLWVCRWQEGDTLSLAWSYRIEKRQREAAPDAISYLYGMSETFLDIAFLTEHTRAGKLQAHLINHATGQAVIQDIADNSAGDLVLLPGRSARLSAREIVCFALAPGGKNGYQIYILRL